MLVKVPVVELRGAGNADNVGHVGLVGELDERECDAPDHDVVVKFVVVTRQFPPGTLKKHEQFCLGLGDRQGR